MNPIDLTNVEHAILRGVKLGIWQMTINDFPIGNELYAVNILWKAFRVSLNYTVVRAIVLDHIKFIEMDVIPNTLIIITNYCGYSRNMF